MNSSETDRPAAAVSPPLADDAHAQRRRSRALFSTGIFALAAFCIYYAVTAKVEEPLHLYLGLGIACLAALPSLRWAKRQHHTLPVFEIFLLTSANTYAIPLLSGHEQVLRFEPETVTTAAMVVLLYLAAANVAFALVTGRPKRSPVWSDEVVSKDISVILSYGMLLATAYTVVVQFTDWIPYEYLGILRALAGGLGNIACFVQSRRWGRGELTPQEKAVFVTLLVAQVGFSFASLLLVGGVSLLLLSFLGFVAGAKKVPLVPIVIALPFLAILHNGKSTMRERYWGPLGNERYNVKIAELPEFFSTWVTVGMRPPAEDPEKSINAKLLERTSLFHILCLIVSVTPERQPYLEGETYSHVLSQFIPRLLWPEKPPAHISTYRLSIYYGLQTEEDTVGTTIGFGLLSEAYANFGFMGAIALGVAFAAAFKKVTTWAAESPLLSYPGLFLILLIAWSFMTELTLSIWLSSLFQASVVVLGIPFAMRRFLR